MVKVRFAPSPTGNLHIGGARTALFNYCFARKNSGIFVLRIEDTDQERSTAASCRQLLSSLSLMGLNWDEGPLRQSDDRNYYQSARFEVYRAKIEEMVSAGTAYRCFCSREELDSRREAAETAGGAFKYDGRCRSLSDSESLQRSRQEKFTVRLKIDLAGETLEFKDLIHGPYQVKTSEFDDFIIQRADGTPTYNLSCVIDDLDMEITHVIRGDDHLSNTPKQLAIYRALGVSTIPDFAHLPMVLGPDGTRLSKRHGAASVEEFLQLGILPEALNNYLAHLGWSESGEQEIFELSELEQKFSLEGVSRSAGKFDIDKLKWFSGQHLRLLRQKNPDEIQQRVLAALNKSPELSKPLEDLNERQAVILADLLIDACDTLNDCIDYASRFLPRPSLEQIKQNFNPQSFEQAIFVIDHLIDKMKPLEFEEFLEIDWLKEAKTEAKSLGLKPPQIFQPLRLIITGELHGPTLKGIINVLGPSAVVSRLQKVHELPRLS